MYGVRVWSFGRVSGESSGQVLAKVRGGFVFIALLLLEFASHRNSVGFVSGVLGGFWTKFGCWTKFRAVFERFFLAFEIISFVALEIQVVKGWCPESWAKVLAGLEQVLGVSSGCWESFGRKFGPKVSSFAVDIPE